MAYTPTTWNNGDVITAEKLNKLERGVQNEQVGPAGQDGVNGKDGVTPTITADATVDDGTGTPEVTVTRSGEDSAPKFTFAFKNLKGAVGTSGKDGAAGANGTNGKDGLSISKIVLKKDSAGAITGGTATMSDNTTTVNIDVETEEATS